MQLGETHIQIDCGPDFRQQMLKNNISKIDAVLLTHEHNDHVIGLDDLRPIMFSQRSPVSLYAQGRVLAEIKKRFEYAFLPQAYPGAPQFYLNEILMPFHIKDVLITPIPVMHGPLPILGYRIGNFAYLTDVKYISDASLDLLQDLDVLILDALHHKEHHAHLTLVEAIAYAGKIGAGKTYFTHMSHSMGLAKEVNSALPDNMALSYDEQIIML